MSSLTATHDAANVAQEIARTLKILHPEGTYELRLLDVPGWKGSKHVYSCYLNRPPTHPASKLADKIKELKPAGSYVTLNPVIPDLVGRAKFKFEKKPKHTTKDEEITKRRWLLVDFDPVKPAGISSNDEEHDAAQLVANAATEWLKSQGCGEPILADSGNGWHLLLPINLPNDDDSLDLVKAVLLAIKYWFDSDAVDVDDSVSNASRITKLYGTQVRKGYETEDRPHRYSKLAYVPDYLRKGWCEPTQRKVLESIAATKPVEQKPAAATKPIDSSFSSTRIEQYVAAIPPPANGNRNNSCFKLAGALHVNFGLEPDAIFPIIAAWCPSLEENEIRRVIASALKNGTPVTPRERVEQTNQHQQSTESDKRDALIYKDAEIGVNYSPSDRDNWGSCVEQTETTVTLQFVSVDGQSATKSFPKSDVKDKQGRLLADKDRPAIKVITSKELDEATFKREFLIRQIAVENQPCVIGGKSKTLKTSILVDAALSIGTGTPFLGQFDVPKWRNVVVLTGESGEATVQETARRVAKQKGVKLSDAAVHWGFELPQLSSDSSLERLQEMIEETKSEVCCVDPAYLCLLEAGQGSSANNMFEVGPLLKRFVDVGKRTNCTMLLCHHLRKWNQSGDQHGVPELEDLAYGGFAQFFRQWILLGRRSQYMGDGEHQLWLAVGGSAGHGGQYGVDVAEGCLQDDFTGRVWEPSVVSGAEQRKRQQKEKEEAKLRKQEEKENRDVRTLREELLNHSDGETARGLKDAAGLNDKAFKAAIVTLLQRDEVELVQITKKNNQQYDAYKPAANLSSPGHRDSPGLTGTEQ